MLWICAAFWHCNTPHSPTSTTNNTMINLEKKTMASWKAPEAVSPINFIYNNEKQHLVSDQKGYWTLDRDQTLSHHTLAEIAELNFLQPAQEGYIVVAFNQADYTNYAYQMQLDGTPSALPYIEDPSNLYFKPINGQYY